MDKYTYTIVMETDNPQDLETLLQNEFQKIAGHRNKIIVYRCDKGFKLNSK